MHFLLIFFSDLNAAPGLNGRILMRNTIETENDLRTRVNWRIGRVSVSTSLNYDTIWKIRCTFDIVVSNVLRISIIDKIDWLNFSWTSEISVAFGRVYARKTKRYFSKRYYYENSNFCRICLCLRRRSKKTNYDFLSIEIMSTYISLSTAFY